jgi:long-chain acyl-CoA synthetase
MATAIYGCLLAGAAFTPLPVATRPERLTEIVADLGGSVLVCERDHVSAADQTAASVDHDVDVIGAELIGPPGEARGPLPIGPDLAAVIYTSGSTGEPKGVTLTNANMAFTADSIAEYLGNTADDRVLCVLPLSFGYGLYQLLVSVRTGGSLLLEPGVGPAGDLLDLIDRERVTGFAAVPTIFQLLLTLKNLGNRELPALRYLTNAGAGLPAPVVEAVRAALPGARLFLMYGQTECQRVCYLPPEEVDSRPGSVGVAMPGTEAWVAGDDGGVAAPDVVGELLVRGPHVMQGYWGRPEATAARLLPGPGPGERVLATGDLFRTDADGHLYFVARRDDIFKSRGEKVVPKQVEEVLHAFPGVREAVVVGIPDKLLGAAVCAHVVLDGDPPPAERDLRRHCAAGLDAHMVPKRIVVHEQLPRLASGKIDRRSLARP